MQHESNFDNISILIKSESSIDDLRNFILTIAVNGTLSKTKPELWRKSTLGEEVDIIRGITFPSSAKHREPAQGLIVCLRTTNVQDEVDWSDLLYVPESYVKTESQLIEMNDILISMANSRELVGKVSLVKRSDIRCTLGGFIASIRCKPNVLPEFLMILLRVPTIRAKLIDSSTQTTNIANISLGRLRPLEIRLPSLDEQSKIISKVAQLFDICDQLERALRVKHSLSTATRKSAVEAISVAQTPEELQLAWERIQNNWEVIAGTPESIESLRNLIRELAVRGVITNGVLKSQTRIEDKKQKLFNIPDSWRWVKLEAVIDFINGYAFRSDEYASSGIGVVRMSDMKSGLVIPDHMKFVPIDRMNSLSKDFQVQPGDIVMGMTGATLGKPCVNRTSKTFLLNQRIGKFVPKDIDSEYLLLVLAYLERSFMNLSFGTGVNNLSTRQIKESVIPLPPADEQVQIVKIVSSLFTICDRLESSLVDTDELSTKFARSMISAST
jgi:type I restriction enzyme S subunit